MATSVEIRSELVEALRLDIVGPDNNHLFAHELIPEPPSRRYLTGFLVPTDAPIDQRTDETADEEIDSGDSGGLDDDAPVDRSAAKKGLLPSSIGISFLIKSSVKKLRISVSWGDYVWESGDKSKEPEEIVEEHTDEDKSGEQKETKIPKGYRRIPRTEIIDFTLPDTDARKKDLVVPNSEGLILSVINRSIGLPSKRLPKGTNSISVFLVNKRKPSTYKSFAFQTEIKIESSESFIPRPDLRGEILSDLSNEWDERLADLHYRNEYEFAVGHGVSTTADKNDSKCFVIKTNWIPTADVERVAPVALTDVELGMEALGGAKDFEYISNALKPLIKQYREWIDVQQLKITGLDTAQTDTANELINLAKVAADRIEAGISILKDEMVLDAFRIANRAMANAARRRESQAQQKSPDEVNPPQWRPFQLAYILMTLRGIVDPLQNDRRIVDLLFFPTGGGKTEAYLGLAAFTMVLRRLKHPGIRSAGVTVIMRYTLRLLTLDQLGRASALMCALELEREKDKKKLGDWPFEIGLWVGTAATPNRMGYQGYNGPGAEDTAYRKWYQFRSNSNRYPAPIPIENCPWCGVKFTPDSFRLIPNHTRPNNLIVHCSNMNCDFSGDRALPIVGVDEPIYRRLPAFIIATVDKFAALPWIGQTGALFGLVDRYDQNGFYGPMQTGFGRSLGGPLPAPELIIQDELHLISGPLGTIAGIYETVIDALAARKIGDTEFRPKIIASTATVRRADSQIQALFGRIETSIFPAQGIDKTDSFFAKTQPTTTTPARLYVGIAAQGRSAKVVLLRASLALLSRGQNLYQQEGGNRNHNNAADPYMTMLGYFNSLRELGGSRRIIEDEVRTRLEKYSRRKRQEPEDNLFVNRTINVDVLELTSRVQTNEIAANKRKLSLPFFESERVDVALATNMISVGLDITRLGLMVVLGQPKSKAEYIQATSRVGRNPERPGLVVTLLNVHKPRDRSHYERFETFHKTFYRAVEPTSVTPFSPRALDRALAATFVALIRHIHSEMNPAQGAELILRLRNDLENLIQIFEIRAENHDSKLSSEERTGYTSNILSRCRRILDDWYTIAQQFATTNTRFQYQRWEARIPAHLLFDWFDSELQTLPEIRKRFRANRSMRDVENSVDVSTRNLNDWSENRQ